MKKSLILILITLSITLCACGKKEQTDSNNNSNSNSEKSNYNYNESFSKLEDTNINELDKELYNYDKKDLDTIISENSIDKDFTNSDKTIDEINNAFESENSKRKSFDELSNYDWSYFDTEFNINNCEDDEYGYVLGYISNKEVKLFNEDSDIIVDDSVSYADFNHYYDGVTANYKVYYSQDTPGIYVYAYVK